MHSLMYPMKVKGEQPTPFYTDEPAEEAESGTVGDEYPYEEGWIVLLTKIQMVGNVGVAVGYYKTLREGNGTTTHHKTLKG